MDKEDEYEDEFKEAEKKLYDYFCTAIKKLSEEPNSKNPDKIEWVYKDDVENKGSYNMKELTSEFRIKSKNNEFKCFINKSVTASFSYGSRYVSGKPLSIKEIYLLPDNKWHYGKEKPSRIRQPDPDKQEFTDKEAKNLLIEAFLNN